MIIFKIKIQHNYLPSLSIQSFQNIDAPRNSNFPKSSLQRNLLWNRLEAKYRKRAKIPINLIRRLWIPDQRVQRVQRGPQLTYRRFIVCGPRTRQPDTRLRFHEGRSAYWKSINPRPWRVSTSSSTTSSSSWPPFRTLSSVHRRDYW